MYQKRVKTKKRKDFLLLIFIVVAAVGLVFLMCFDKQVNSSPMRPEILSDTEDVSVYNLPSPTRLVSVSEKHSSPVLKGIKVDPQDPFNFEFIIDSMDEGALSKEEAGKLVEYFLAALTIPEDDLWVNLSPFEEERVVSDRLAETELGKDLLAEDYVLKQLASSLTYPESESGKQYWDKIYGRVFELTGKTDIPIDTHNKVWIVPANAQIYEDNNTAIITDSSLKSMHEEDYFAMANIQDRSNNKLTGISRIASDAMKEIILPQIDRDINRGENFSKLRQMYNAFVLAAWFKQRLCDSIYQYYIDQGKIDGIDLADKNVKEKIFNLYVQAYKNGVYNYIKKDYDKSKRSYINRRYYSGGIAFNADSFSTAEIATPALRESLLSPFKRTKERIARLAVRVVPRLGRRRSQLETQLPVLAETFNTSELPSGFDLIKPQAVVVDGSRITQVVGVGKRNGMGIFIIPKRSNNREARLVVATLDPATRNLTVTEEVATIPVAQIQETGVTQTLQLVRDLSSSEVASSQAFTDKLPVVREAFNAVDLPSGYELVDVTPVAEAGTIVTPSIGIATQLTNGQMEGVFLKPSLRSRDSARLVVATLDPATRNLTVTEEVATIPVAQIQETGVTQTLQLVRDLSSNAPATINLSRSVPLAQAAMTLIDTTEERLSPAVQEALQNHMARALNEANRNRRLPVATVEFETADGQKRTKSVRLLQFDNMPEGIPAYHFLNNRGELVVAVPTARALEAKSKDLLSQTNVSSADVIKDRLLHEVYEDFFGDHTLAWFAQTRDNGGQLTAEQRLQIAERSRQGDVEWASRMTQEDRAEHETKIKQFFGQDAQSLKQVEALLGTNEQAFQEEVGGVAFRADILDLDVTGAQRTVFQNISLVDLEALKNSSGLDYTITDLRNGINIDEFLNI